MLDFKKLKRRDYSLVAMISFLLLFFYTISALLSQNKVLIFVWYVLFYVFCFSLINTIFYNYKARWSLLLALLSFTSPILFVLFFLFAPILGIISAAGALFLKKDIITMIISIIGIISNIALFILIIFAGLVFYSFPS